jgi:type I restriction enzyme S subunit
MSSEWPSALFADLIDQGAIEIGDGYRAKNDELGGDGLIFLRAGHVKDTHIDFAGVERFRETGNSRFGGKVARVGDVVITTKGNSTGRVAHVTTAMPRFVYSPHLSYWRSTCTTLIEQGFLRAWSQSAEFLTQLEAMSRSTDMAPYLSLSDQRRLRITLPPLAVQKQVAALNDAIHDRIALLRETNATLEAIAQALFKSWFVDFDPVRARMEGRAPEGMDAATAALFPASFEESELGWVPRGWQLVRFGSLLSHTIGGDWGGELPDEVNEARVAIIRGTDIPDLRSGANSRVPIRYTSKKKLATRRLLDGDIVLEVSGGSKDQPTGRALHVTDGMLDQFDCPVEPASFCRLLRPISKHVGVLLAQHLTYIYAKGKTWEYQNQSTGIANFQTSHFLETELVAVPPPELLAMFSDIVRLTIERSHLTQIQQLATLRDTLLPRLISGQLRLPDAEAMAPETA